MEHLNVLVLIVEDDKYMNQTLFEVLASEGYNVDTSNNVKDAVNKIKYSSKQYDLLILDYDLGNLKGITGLDVFGIAKEMNPGIKAVMITGYGIDNKIKNKALNSGINAYIEKPFMITDLVDTVDGLTREEVYNN